MNLEKAKLVLASYRPGIDDESDPEIAQAWKLAEKQPELMEWFAQQHALDEAIADQLDKVEVPEALADKIISERKPTPANVRPVSFHPLALAAMIVLFLGIGSMILFNSSPTPDTPLAAFRQDMVGFLKVFPRLDMETERLNEVHDWLATKPALKTVSIPKGLTRFPSIGCRSVDWEGKRASLVCFMVDGEVVHLFVLPKAEWPLSDLPDTPTFARHGATTTATWLSEETVFVALSKGSEAFLKKHL